MNSDLNAQILESGEMYLETILLLERDLGEVRQVDIARALGFKRPTVHIAVKKLADQGLLQIDESNKISLSPQGRQIAEAVYARHQTFTRFLVHLGVDQHTAEMDACRIEHYVSEQTFQRIKDYCDKIAEKPKE